MKSSASRRLRRQPAPDPDAAVYGILTGRRLRVAVYATDYHVMTKLAEVAPAIEALLREALELDAEPA